MRKIMRVFTAFMLAAVLLAAMAMPAGAAGYHDDAPLPGAADAPLNEDAPPQEAPGEAADPGQEPGSGEEPDPGEAPEDAALPAGEAPETVEVIPEGQQALPGDLEATARADGAAAAQLLNALANEALFLEGAGLVLDIYYGEAGFEAQLAAFAAAIDARAEALLARYAAAAAEREAPAEALGYVPGQVMVVFGNGVPAKNAEGVLAAATEDTTAEVVEVVEDPTGNAPVVATAEVSLEQTVAEAVAQYEADPAVAWAQPVFLYEPQADMGLGSTNDPAKSKQSWLDIISAPDAWAALDALPGAGSKVRVALVDSAVNMNHPDLLANVNPALARNFVYHEPQGRAPMWDETDGHGTMLAGVMGATGNNGVGIAGAASGFNNDYIEIMPLNVHTTKSDSAHYVHADTWAMGYAIRYAASNGARVISLGYALERDVLGDYDDLFVKAAIDFATDAGCLVVAPAGNSASVEATFWPACYSNVLGVTALDATGTTRWERSNHRPDHISAPGVGVYTTKGKSYTSSYNGTSLATPMVSAAAAMLYYVNPTFTPAQVRGYLTASAIPLADTTTGVGRLDAGKAVVNAIAATGGLGNTGASVSAPQNLRVTEVSASTISLEWDPVDGATGYKLYPSKILPGEDPSEFGTPTDLLAGTTVYIDDNGGQGHTVNQYRQYYVVAVKGAATSPRSNVVEAATVLDPPASLSVTSQAYDTLLVEWTATPGADGYEIRRAESENGPYTLVKLAARGDTAYTDTGLAMNKEYWYRVYPFITHPLNGRNTLGAYAQESGAPTLPGPAPFTINVTAHQVAWTWGVVPGASGYRITRTPEGGGATTTFHISGAAKTSFIDSSLPADSYIVTLTPYRIVGGKKLYGLNSIPGTSGLLVLTVPALTALTDLTATADASAWNKATLTWTPSAEDTAAGYVVYRSADGGTTYDEIAVLKGRATGSYVDTAAPAGATHYKVAPYATIAKARHEGNAATAALSGTVKGLGAVDVTGVAPPAGKHYQLTVTWNKIADAGGYNIYRSADAGATWTLAKSVGASASSYTDTALPAYDHEAGSAALAYTYRVAAWRGKKTAEGLHTGATGSGSPTALTAAGNVQVDNTGLYHRLKISWDKVPGATGYKIYRSVTISGSDTLPRDSLLVGTVKGQNTTRWTDPAYLPPQSGTDGYGYTVVAYNAVGKATLLGGFASGGVSSGWGNSQTLPAVGAPTANKVAYHSVKLDWTPVAGAAGYNIYVRVYSGPFTLHATVKGQKAKTYTFTETTQTNADYTFRVVPLAKYVTSGFEPYESTATHADLGPVTPDQVDEVANLQIQADGWHTFKLSWTPAPGATGYQIERSGAGETKTIIIKSGKTAAYTDKAVEAGTYQYDITSMYTVGGKRLPIGYISAYSNCVPTTAGTVANLTVSATPGQYNSVTLNWTKSDNAQGYLVYYSANGTDYGAKPIATLTKNTKTTYTHTGINDAGGSAAWQARYKVLAYRSVSGKKLGGQPLANATAAAASPTLLGAPAGFTVGATVSNQAVLTWNQRVGANGYNLYRSTDGGATYTLLYKATKNTVVSYVDKGLPPGNYHYKLAATTGKARAEGIITTARLAAVENAPAPGAFDAEQVPGKRTVAFTWNASLNATGYYLYAKGPADTDYTRVATVADKGKTNYISYKLSRTAGKWRFYLVPYYKSGKTIYTGTSTGAISLTVY